MDVSEKTLENTLHDEGDGDASDMPTSTVAFPPRLRNLHDSAVSFQEYKHYADSTRAEQEQIELPRHGNGISRFLLPNLEMSKMEESPEKFSSNYANLATRMTISDEEWVNASRAMRTATASAVFYLITTDILGPFGLGYAFATTGWAPGTVLYTIFGALAGVSGYLLWDCFMGLDSYEFPIKNFADIGFRVYGNWCRTLFNILQSLQLVCNVGALVISNGQALSEAVKFKLCYAVCCLVLAVAGFVLGQVRTLQRFTWLANAAVWINLVIMFITMGAAAHSPPLYSASALSAGSAVDPKLVTPVNGTYPPVQHSVGLPNTADFSGSLTGAMQAVYSYGGCMIFPEFMAESRRPRDFLKGMWSAQAFIYVCYMLYGLFMYAYQGQYVQTPSYLGISGYALQTASNALAIITALICAALYSNIGIKLLYNNILVEIFHAPPLEKKGSKFIWISLVPIYWSIAYIIAAAIPAFAGFTSIVAATCILQFTYTFPPLVHLGYRIQLAAMQDEDGFDPTTGQVRARDKGVKRYIRGFFSGRWYINVLNVLYFLGAATLGVLGIYSSVKTLIVAYAVPQLNAFGCKSPLDLSA